MSRVYLQKLCRDQRDLPAGGDRIAKESLCGRGQIDVHNRALRLETPTRLALRLSPTGKKASW